MRAREVERLADVPVEQYRSFLLHANEFVYRRLDAATRRTGRIVRCYRLLDFAGGTLIDFSLKMTRRDAEQQKVVQDLYPQLLGGAFAIGMPGFIKAIWEGVKPLMPPQVARGPRRDKGGPWQGQGEGWRCGVGGA